ncbi:probable E3 ubiquitin-protein ligase TRIML1 [Dromiciops gliroides]|uniref:probable E3 ubiquitin-protein ligase TRIML1 n=1 Tax=Dromiciops gliroides TaxID=33562 RepID=UPI001CC3EE6D|nr:probable E3 ubiquitin-protein ligase TRIML1 [Dromiciops gliroides]XP_043836594.1 probable E3 ubiquitin-protein ligase TRIML1 [Dromiciops gliroides]
MDVKGLIESLKDDLTCSICLGYFTDPVTVKCGHSFCTQCLLQCREGADATLTCPECRGVIRSCHLIPNKGLQNLSITGQMLRPHLLQNMVALTTCGQHGEKEKLFCEEDQRPLCESCSLAPEHKDHHVLPMDKAAEKWKDSLQETRTVLQRKEEKCKVALNKVKRREEYCKEDLHALKQSVMSEYEKIYQFFRNEEDRHLLELEQEFRNNMAKHKTNKAKLLQQIQNLQRMILEVEENLDKAPSEMFQVMKIPLENNEEQLLHELEVDCSTWSTCPITGLREMLTNFHRDITLDPETADPHFILSEDLKHVECRGVQQDLPDNQERSEVAFSVLGAQTFTSGQHYWEVELADNTEWEVGVCKDSVSQNGNLSMLLEDVTALAGYRSADDFFIWKLQSGCFLSKPIDKMGIFLDCDKGHIAFYNVLEETLIYSPPETSFQGTLRPYFAICPHNQEGTPASLSICPRINK